MRAGLRTHLRGDDPRLPRPGPLWGPRPERPEPAASARAPRRGGRLGDARTLAARAGERLQAMAGESFGAWRGRVAARLAREGPTRDRVIDGLALAARAMRETRGLTPHPNQLHCAALLLDERLVEMATGEGKTIAAALAAAVAALAGSPVHLLTANDYLARRDAESLAPFYGRLGLTVGAALEDQSPDARRSAWGQDIAYATSRTLAFDHLRDRLAEPGQPMLLRGLCVAIVDEADGTLLDEARTPLVIARAVDEPSRRALLWQTLDLARDLREHDDFRRAPGAAPLLTDAGRAALAGRAHRHGGAWLNALHREEMVTQALHALHGLHRDIDYLVRDGAIAIVDATTGRIAPGRQWSRQLHALVALKEGQPLPPETRTDARTTYPRLFARYHRLAGLSGTLAESARELRRTYGLEVVAVPRHAPLARRTLPMRLFADREGQFGAAVARTLALVAQGRPVLLATDHVSDARRLAQRLREAGLAPAVLDAQQDADEAAAVAAAGLAGRVTVATQVAGRGTDIRLGPGVAEAGGLHVLALQHNRSRRIDRQIEGRSGRQGDPGSAEHWLRLTDGFDPADAPPLAAWVHRLLGALAERPQARARSAGSPPDPLAALTSATAARLLRGWQQRWHGRTDAWQRRRSLEDDRNWSTRLRFDSIGT